MGRNANQAGWDRRRLLALRSMPGEAIREILSETRRFAEAAPGSTYDDLAGRHVAMLFFEDSTRTRGSFTVAAQRLGAMVVDLSGKSTSVNKGETLIDTAATVEAFGVAAMVVRSSAAGAADLIGRHVKCAVINAGDGGHEHPTQGLLDAYTLCEALARLDGFDLKGVRIAIVGDVAHSRVARSAIAVMRTLGAEVTIAGPAGMVSKGLGAALGCAASHEFDAVIPEMDAVMMLRCQFERGAAIASAAEHRALWQLDAARAAAMKDGAVVMHPGPANRGLEVASEVADGARSVIRRQVQVGVFVRMAALRLCRGA
ncbi:MAG: aspartate carbamoyltransferase catalytic subunit [Planctomycetota bacterium]|nr:aspartate carbamoyltransferase catalytic subunit [Planctomycetota bacterium]